MLQQSRPIFGRPGSSARWGVPMTGWAASIASQIHAWFLQDRERWWLWIPVALGCGIAFYFGLPVEPASRLIAPLVLVAAIAAAWRQRDGDHRWLFVSVMLAAGALGFLAGQIRTDRVAAPVVPYQGAFTIEGTVTLAEPRGQRQRVVLEDLSFEQLAPAETPGSVRVTLRPGGPELSAGDRIAVRARLQPPGGPVMPGAFDFARQAFFAGPGGLGFAIGDVTLIAAGEADSWRLRVAALRQHIADRAHDAIEGSSAAVAAALLTALRADIGEAVWRDMQLAGLAHLLAISGLHMGLVAGTVFLLVRYAVALLPDVALRWPAKKPAAVVALAVATFYLALAGATVPTTRAYIMTGVALIAVTLDRNPFSMRLVAVAATLILLFRPESLLGASFQMSFAAVIGLIAFYEARPFARSDDAEKTTGDGQGWRLVWLYVIGVATTTLIASLATAPLGAYHFQRIAAYGIVANLVGVPLTAFWIMPWGLVALAAMPFGLDRPCFAMMGLGIDLLLALAAWVAALPGAGLSSGLLPISALIAFALGGLWLCLWQARWRWACSAFWLVAMLIVLNNRPPDLVIHQGGGLIAVRNTAGSYDLVQWRRDAYLAGAWQRALGGLPFSDFPDPATGLAGSKACDAAGCTTVIDQKVVAFARTPAAAQEDCGRADIVVATRAVDRCAGDAMLIGSRELWLSQGLSLWIDGDRIRRATVAEQRGERPWTAR